MRPSEYPPISRYAENLKALEDYLTENYDDRFFWTADRMVDVVFGHRSYIYVFSLLSRDLPKYVFLRLKISEMCDVKMTSCHDQDFYRVKTINDIVVPIEWKAKLFQLFFEKMDREGILTYLTRATEQIRATVKT
jgi:hypothetical protein